MKKITILGSGDGISKGVARKFGKEGFGILLISRTESKLQNLVAELAEESIEADYAVADASDQEQLYAALAELRDRNGHSDMILYNAAALDAKDLLEQDWETIRHTMDTTVGGAFHMLKLVLSFCLDQDRGKIFFTGGGLAMQGHPQWTSLSMGKAALRNLVQAGQARAKNSNVHVAQVTVCGAVNPDDPKYKPAAIAEEFWKLYWQKPGDYQGEIMY